MITRRFTNLIFAVFLGIVMTQQGSAGETGTPDSKAIDTRIRELTSQVHVYEEQRKEQDALASDHQKVLDNLKTLEVAPIFAAQTNAERLVLIDELEGAITMPAALTHNVKVLWQEEKDCITALEQQKNRARTILQHLESPENQSVVLVSRVRSKEDPARVAEWKFEIAKKEKKVAELLQTRTEAHPLVRQLHKELKTLREKVSLYPKSATREDQMTVKTNIQNTTLKRELADVKVAIQTSQQRLVDIRQEIFGIRDQIVRFVEKARARHQVAARKALDESKALASKIAAANELLASANREKAAISIQPKQEEDCDDSFDFSCLTGPVLKWGGIALGALLALFLLAKVCGRIRSAGRSASGIDKATGLQVLGHVPQFETGKAGD